MKAWPDLAIEKQLIHDTFRQARASGIFWMMLTVTCVCVALCLSVNVSGDAVLQNKDDPGLFLPRSSPNSVSAREEGIETIGGRMTLAFGAVSIPLGRDRADAVHFLELILAWGLAGTLGVLLTLVWTAGFVPSFLQSNAASVMLTKPVTRRRLLLGKYLGVLTFVGFQVVLFVFSTWLALAIRTDVWDTSYWCCIPLLLLQFAIFYSFSVLLAVLTRSAVACVFGSLLFWLLAWGINYGSAMTRGGAEPESLPPFTVGLARAAYWISPKPIDGGLMLFNALDAQAHFEKPLVFKLLESEAGFTPVLSILSSLISTGLLLALAIHELNAKDY